MRLFPPSLLGLLRVAAVLTVAACTVNATGLSHVGETGAALPDGGAGASAISGTAGAALPSGGAGAGTLSGGAGDTSAAGGTAGSGGGAAGTGAAGDGSGGAAGDGTGTAGQGQAGDGPSDAGGTAGSTTGGFDAHPPAWVVGCADGSREGLLSLARFPDVAACSGAWTVPGLVAPETLKPQCGRAAGNDGAKPGGDGCSVADLCAEGWHVCESAQELAAKAMNCDEAFPGGAVKMFFASRQHGLGPTPAVTCDPTNEMGTNNVYGCGNFGSNAVDCAPFMHMLRDADCKNTPPWMCVNGPIGYSTSELDDVTKTGSEHGGVLCCR
jgi:hypothetical protein